MERKKKQMSVENYSLNILNKTKVYLAGPMQYTEQGESWRDEFEKFAKDLNIICFNPYKKPFVNDIKEDTESKNLLNSLMSEQRFDEVHKLMKDIRYFDLAMVDRVDFIVCHINPDVPTYGTVEELATAVRMKKPVFIFVDGDLTRIPFWLLGMFRPHCFYKCLDDVFITIKKINSGEIEINNKNWKLLREEYR